MFPIYYINLLGGRDCRHFFRRVLKDSLNRYRIWGNPRTFIFIVLKRVFAESDFHFAGTIYFRLIAEMRTR